MHGGRPDRAECSVARLRARECCVHLAQHALRQKRSHLIHAEYGASQPAARVCAASTRQAPACAEASYKSVGRWISRRWPAAHSCHCQSCALEQVVRLVAAAKKEHRCAQGLAVAPRRAALLRHGHGTGPLGKAPLFCVLWQFGAESPRRRGSALAGGRRFAEPAIALTHLEDRSHRSHAGADAHLHSPAQMERGTASPAV